MDQAIDSGENTSVQGGQDASQTETDAKSYEAKAREMGWKPEEQFKGDKSKWIDAKSYVERGETVLPIVQAQLRKTREELEEVRKTAQEWVEFNKADTARREAEWKVQLDAAIQSRKDAIAQGDGDKVVEAEAQIDELKASKPQSKKEAATVHPDFAAWRAENEWYGTDKKRTLQANMIGADLAAEGLRGRELFDAVNVKLAEFDEMAQGKARGGPQRGGRPANETRGAKVYENLKPEFRDACDRAFKHFGGKSKPEDFRKTWTSQASDDMFRS